MARLHLIELHEQTWCPALVRDGIRAVLHGISTTLPGYEAVTTDLLEAMERCGSTEVVDLCAGSGGPWARIAPHVADDPRLERVHLTDFYPDPVGASGAEQRTDGLVKGHPDPVDATNVPRSLRGFRTVFNAFHHFEPGRARAVLASAAEAGEGIAIYELTERRPFATAFVATMSIPLALGLLPFARPFRWGWVPLTYLLPVIPGMLVLDGFVSCLRTYHPEELLELGRAAAPHYHWEAGRKAVPGGPLHIVYLTGTPPPEDQSPSK